MSTLLVTAYSRGQLALYPRLHTWIQQLKHQSKVIGLIDTGFATSEEAWICQATENRAPYFILDAMGYTIAFADDLSPTNIEAIQAQTQIRLVPTMEETTLADPKRDEQTWVIRRDVTLAYPRRTNAGHIILPTPSHSTVLSVRLDEALTTQAHPLPQGTLPDATITATIDFILDEARYYHKKRNT